MIHHRRRTGNVVDIVECWRDGDAKVLLVSGLIYDDIAKTRDENARWRLLKQQAIAVRKKANQEGKP